MIKYDYKENDVTKAQLAISVLILRAFIVLKLITGIFTLRCK